MSALILIGLALVVGSLVAGYRNDWADGWPPVVWGCGCLLLGVCIGLVAA